MYNRYNFNQFIARHFKVPADIEIGIQEIATLLGINKTGMWIVGGAVRRTIKGEFEVKSDYDIAFASHSDVAKAEAALTEDGYKLKWHNTMCRTFVKDKRTVQLLIGTFYKTVEDCLDTFDFTVCQFGYDGEELIYCPLALYDLGRNALVPNKISFAVASLRRMFKYQEQGYRICTGGMTNFLTQCKTLDITAITEYID
jgi:hypothetical protein